MKSLSLCVGKRKSCLEVWECVERGAWKEFLSQLLSPSLLTKARGELTLFGHVLVHNPPMYVIRHIVRLHPDIFEQECDASGRLPLHLLLVTNNSMQLIQYALEICPHATTRSDHDGTIPLHRAILHTCSNGNTWTKHDRRKKQTMIQVVALLIQANPRSVLIADPFTHNTALDLALQLEDYSSPHHDDVQKVVLDMLMNTTFRLRFDDDCHKSQNSSTTNLEPDRIIIKAKSMSDVENDPSVNSMCQQQPQQPFMSNNNGKGMTSAFSGNKPEHKMGCVPYIVCNNKEEEGTKCPRRRSWTNAAA